MLLLHSYRTLLHRFLVLLQLVIAPWVIAQTKDISEIPADLEVPPLTDGPPAAGVRVKQVLPEFKDTQVYHALYLPTDWRADAHFPVIVEYAGNGNYRNQYGDVSTGLVDGSKLGYGISGGKGYIWISVPFVDAREKTIATQWWGDVAVTIDYCKKAVRMICEQYGGDSSAVILTGFSRGAIGCGYIGLHDDEIADLWLAFVPYSHYDGATRWPYPDSDAASAIERMKRLKGRASFVCQELSVEKTRQFITTSGINAPFVFQDLPFRNHNDAWILRETPARAALRSWLSGVLRDHPGTYAIRGVVSGADGRPLVGAQIASGASHWATSNARGSYEIRGLIEGARTVSISKEGVQFAPAQTKIVIEGHDIDGVNFSAVK